MSDKSNIASTLETASDVADFFGLEEEKKQLDLALRVDPHAEAAWFYFQTEPGRRAIDNLDKFLTYFSNKEGLDAIRVIKAVLAAVDEGKERP